MRKCFMIFVAVLITSALIAQNPHVRMRVVDGKSVLTHDLKVIPNQNGGMLIDLATGDIMIFVKVGDTYYELNTMEMMTKGPALNPVPPNTGLSCICCNCGCSFSSRMTSWGCKTCPACGTKLAFDMCSFMCDCGVYPYPCSLFKIEE